MKPIRLIFFLVTASLVAEETKTKIPPLELPDREVLTAYERAAEQNALAARDLKFFLTCVRALAVAFNSGAGNSPNLP